MLLPAVAKMRPMLLSASCPVIHDSVADEEGIFWCLLGWGHFSYPVLYSVIFGSSGLGECAPPWSRTEQYTSVDQSQLVAASDVLMI